MEHPYNLLEIVLKHYYNSRPEILEKTTKIIDGYRNNMTNYPQTLSNIYELMSDLPSEILLYYLTTVPLPKTENIDSSESPLPGLVKRLLVPAYHNSIRPLLLKYIKEHLPQKVPHLPAKNDEMLEDKTISTKKKICILSEKENVRSVIDDKIKQSKKRNIRGRGKKNIAKKTYEVQSLGLLCASKICNTYDFLSVKYNKLIATCNFILDQENTNNEMSRYEIILRDAEKKLKWLNMFKTGEVPIEIIEQEYGNSEIFYLERRHLLET